MDGGNENNEINLKKDFITRENIVDLFKKHNVPQVINLLSVDIDFNDFYVLHEILKNYTCDIIICEYNATHLAHEDKIVKYDPNGRWDDTNYFGVSLLSLQCLGKLYNYSLVYCNGNGVNCYLIRDDLIKNKNLEFQTDINIIYRPARYGNGPNGGHTQDRLNREYICSSDFI